MKNKYKWHGKPVKTTFGNCIVRTDKDRPLCWYNYECAENGMACIPAIRVETKEGQSFTIANHFGIGVYKLMKGGWPDCTHFSLEGEFSTIPQLKISEFDADGYAQHEAERNKWQERHFPEEYKKMRAILEIANSGVLRMKPISNSK